MWLQTGILIFVSIVLFYFLLRRGVKVYSQVLGIRHPEFYFHTVVEDKMGVPVFTYHSIASEQTPDSVTPDDFERHLQYLIGNDYQTLSSSELLEHLINHTSVPKRSVVLTFDDGRASFWTIAFPIIKKYGVNVVNFLIPALIQESGIRNSMEIKLDESFSYSSKEMDADLSENPYITWAEAKEMHASGLIDFQSHTLDHSRIFISDKIVDYLNPISQIRYCRYILKNPNGELSGLNPRQAGWGQPIYESDSRMGSARRYVEDQKMQEACVNYVKERGDEKFFGRSNWLSEISNFSYTYKTSHPFIPKYETLQEQHQEIRHSLSESKRLIEMNLPGKKVNSVCFPWHRYSSLALSIARESGYECGWIDLNPQKLVDPAKNNPYGLDHWIPTNTSGDDPFFISRIDARDEIILSLPGSTRITLVKRICKKFFLSPAFISTRKIR